MNLAPELHFSDPLTDPAGIEPAAIKLQTGALTPWTTKGLLNPYNKQTESDDDDHGPREIIESLSGAISGKNWIFIEKLAFSW